MLKLRTGIRHIVKWTDRWKCQCLMIEDLAIWMDQHKLCQKSLQILATIMSFLTLVLSIFTLQGKGDFLIYHPAHRHYLLTSLQNIPSYQFLTSNCHYFDSLAHIKYVGFDRLMFYQIRIVILFVLWVVDMLGLLFSFFHPPCGTKMYVFGLTITLLFFVLFPSQLCINFGSDCIEFSPIFKIYKIEFLIQFNVVWLGIGAVGLILLIYPINYLMKEYCNICQIGDLFFNTIYGIASIPFFAIAIINFVAALWTSLAIVNILTLASTVINYLLYHSSTTVRKQKLQHQKQVKRLRQNLHQNEDIFQGYFDQMQLSQSFKSDNFNEKDQVKKQKKIEFKSNKKPDRMEFYREWQSRLQKDFYQT